MSSSASVRDAVNVDSDVREGCRSRDGWGSTETFSIADVWLAPARDARPGKARRRVYITLLGAGAGLGALIGSIVTALLMR